MLVLYKSDQANTSVGDLFGAEQLVNATSGTRARGRTHGVVCNLRAWQLTFKAGQRDLDLDQGGVETHQLLL